MLPLATIQIVSSVERHPNADALDIVGILGYKAIVKRGQWKEGDLCVFIQPDSVLPDAPWATFYKAKSGRVKAIKLRGIFSFGVVESLSILGDVALKPDNAWTIREGVDVTDHLGVIKYEAPAPQDLAAAGPYGLGIPKTDEERWQSIDDLPYGKLVDVTLKKDGQSWSAFWAKQADGVQCGIGGRSFVYKPDSENNYTRNEKQYNVLQKLAAFCERHGTNLCLRAEQCGLGIQKSANNPDSKLPLSLAFFSTWLINERRYATKGHPYYIHSIAQELGLPVVPVIERDVVLTKGLIKKYAEDLEVLDGRPFEGVVINHSGGSFKVINLHYDSKK